MKQVLAAAVLVITSMGGVLSAHAQASSSPGSTGPVISGSVRVTLPTPDREKWDVQVANNGASRVFRCKPLACAVQQTVFVTYQKSPTTRIDPTALERYATVEVPKSLRAAAASRSVLSEQNEKVETLVSKVMTIKDYPGVFNESKIVKAKSPPNFYATDIVFAGNLMIRIVSSSPDRTVANSTLKEFIDVMVIVQGPPVSPSQPLMPRNSNAPRVQEL